MAANLYCSILVSIREVRPHSPSKTGVNALMEARDLAQLRQDHSQGSNVMALDPQGAALALHRFGFGPKTGSKTGSIEAIAPDPMGALVADLEAAKAGQIVNADLASSGAEARTVFEFQAERNAQMNLERRRREAAQGENPDAGNTMAAAATLAKPNTVPPPRQIFLDEARARFDAATNADVGFVERLVWFWSNHFCVSLNVTVMAGAYEREAIRP